MPLPHFWRYSDKFSPDKWRIPLGEQINLYESWCKIKFCCHAVPGGSLLLDIPVFRPRGNPNCQLPASFGHDFYPSFLDHDPSELNCVAFDSHSVTLQVHSVTLQLDSAASQLDSVALWVRSVALQLHSVASQAHSVALQPDSVAS